jgi:transcriptional regulator with XRE-family HTH domain
MPSAPKNASPLKRRQLAAQAKALKAARAAAGLSQPGAAKLLCVPLWTYRAWEHGVRQPRLAERDKIAREWGVSEKALGFEASGPVPALRAGLLRPLQFPPIFTVGPAPAVAGNTKARPAQLSRAGLVSFIADPASAGETAPRGPGPVTKQVPGPAGRKHPHADARGVSAGAGADLQSSSRTVTTVTCAENVTPDVLNPGQPVGLNQTSRYVLSPSRTVFPITGKPNHESIG